MKNSETGSTEHTSKCRTGEEYYCRRHDKHSFRSRNGSERDKQKNNQPQITSHITDSNYNSNRTYVVFDGTIKSSARQMASEPTAIRKARKGDLFGI